MGIKITPRLKVTTRGGNKTIPVGTIAEDNVTGNRFLRVTAGAAIAQYDAVRVVGGLTNVQSVSAVNQPYIGVAQAAIANGADGWIQIEGKMTCKVTVATAAGSPLASTAVAGTLGLADATHFASPGKATASVIGVAAGSEVYMS